MRILVDTHEEAVEHVKILRQAGSTAWCRDADLDPDLKGVAGYVVYDDGGAPLEEDQPFHLEDFISVSARMKDLPPLSPDPLLEKFPPSCRMGYTREDLERYFGAKEGEVHPLWQQLRGQTGSICEGRSYNREKEEYEPSACADNPHGFISYTRDVLEWYRGEPVSDW